MDPEIRQQNKEAIAQNVSEGFEAAKTGVKESAAYAQATLSSGA